MRVRATQMGFLNGITYLPGDIFDVEPEFFADVHDTNAHKAQFGWMEKVEDLPQPAVEPSQDSAPAPTQDASA